MKAKNFTRVLIWESMIVVGLLIIIGLGVLVGTSVGAIPNQPAAIPVQAEALATVTTLPTPPPAHATDSPPSAPAQGGLVHVSDVGGTTMRWVEADQTDITLSQSYLYLLLRDGTVYHGPMQFDPSFVPTGSTVIMAEKTDLENATQSTFVLNILPGPNTTRDGGTLLQPNQVVFQAGERADVEQRLEASSMLSLNLKDLFPNGWFDSNVDAPRQNTISLRKLTETDASTPLPTATFVVVTSTPTPENMMTLAAMAGTATRQATATGTATPIPDNWVTPWAVTSTPTPANEATAQFRLVEATAAAKLYGTLPPPPPNMVTATPQPTPTLPATETPTPIFILLEGELPPMTPTPLVTVEPTPPIPAALMGKIAFKSDRTGKEEIYVVNADGSDLALLTNPWPYNLAKLSDGFSADGRFRVFTKDMIRYQNIDLIYSTEILVKRDDVPALYWYDSLYKTEEQLTHFGAGIAYQGVWSPTSEQIAFVSNDSADDEIWRVDRDGSNLLQLTSSNVEFNAREIGKETFVPEVNRAPSWSPDGTQIVFWSNRTGNRQIWVMNADGSNAYSLSHTGFNDWDPVWIKYPGLPPHALTDHIPYFGSYNPVGEDRNCQDFESVAEAQAFYLAAGGPYRDPHKLDRNNDGIACNY